MSLKMKLAGTVLALSSTFAGAQTIDLEKESQENPAGATALVCASTGLAVLAHNPSFGSDQTIKDMIARSTSSGNIAYKSADVFRLKSVSLSLSIIRDLNSVQSSDASRYSSFLIKNLQVVNSCSQMFPAPILR